MKPRTLFALASIASLCAAAACGGDDSGTTPSPDGGSKDGSSGDSSAHDSSPGTDAGADTAPGTDSGADSSPADSGMEAGDARDARDAGDAGDAGNVVTVGTGGLSFSPSLLNIHVGDTVTWVWASSGHNVVSGTTAADNKFCSPNDMSCANAPTSTSGAMYSHTFSQAGSFPYFCAPHRLAGMTGTIVVQ